MMTVNFTAELTLSKTKYDVLEMIAIAEGKTVGALISEMMDISLQATIGTSDELSVKEKIHLTSLLQKER